jgi:hypothetical protein
MPSVDGAKPTAFVMPVSWDEVTWMVVPKREEVPPAMLRKALENGRKWEQVEFEGSMELVNRLRAVKLISMEAAETESRWSGLRKRGAKWLSSHLGRREITYERQSEQ